MQKINDLTKKESLNLDLESNFNEALENNDFKNLVKSLNKPMKEMVKYTSKLQNTVIEQNNCKSCQGLFSCKNSLNGHINTPIIEENRVYFTYLPCKYYSDLLQKETECKNNKKVMMADINTDDKKQLKVIKWLDEFYSNFDLSKNMEGLYLHGNFGSGKTYLLSALIHELEVKKNVSTEIIYFEDMLRTLKEDWDLFSDKIKWYSNVDILMIDDIGAEKMSEWARDEVLAPILQSRMNNGKTTFFTSNFTITELESHLSLTKSGVDVVKSKRIIERIKQLTKDMELISENRRKKWEN